ncbi:MAG: tetratricopeptide repeat protein [Deltaproteobacteria bacterium]|nr:tetratricopeptide repeat protein [Deltaproteobacteria bacterium]
MADGRYKNTDGRMQALDGAGNPMFDAGGQPIWEPPPEEQAKQLFEEAVALQMSIQGAAPNEAAALDRLSRAVQLVPDFSEAWYNLGRLQLKMNNLPEAKRSLKKAKDLEPERIDAYLALGLTMERAGEFAGAARTFELGLAKDKDNVELLNGVARILRKQGRTQKALDKAKGILRINSNSLDAYNTLGLCYLDQGQLELARFVFLKAEASVPGGGDSASIQANMGLVFFRMGKEYAAEERFNAARALDPDHVGAMVNLAYIKLKNYDFEGARALLEQAHRTLPGSDAIKLDLGVAYRGTGDVENARRLYDEVVIGGSEHALAAMLNLGILQADFDKDYSSALTTYNKYKAERLKDGGVIADDDPVHSYITEAERAKERIRKKADREAKKKARAAEKARKAAEAAKAAETQNSGTSGGAEGQ